MPKSRTLLMGEDEQHIRVRFPDGIGYVDIRRGGVHGATGYPTVVVEVTSTSAETPADDGRLCEQQHNQIHHNIYMVGRPTAEGEK